MSAKMPKVAVVILNFNGKNVLENCLKSILNSCYENLQVIVVDNDSKDGSLKNSQHSFPEVLFLQNRENLGFAKGNNVGIRRSLSDGADYVMILNNDTIVDKNFLDELVNVGENNPQIGLLSPVIMQGNEDRIWFSGGKIDWLRMKTIHRCDSLSDRFRQSNFITGCAACIKKQVFEKVGFLDEDYFLYWEDADFCHRTKKSGFQSVVVGASKIRHFEISETTNKNKVYWLVLSGLLFFKKNSPLIIRPWILIYFQLRQFKNWLDRKRGKNENAEIVHKAYLDFKNVK